LTSDSAYITLQSSSSKSNTKDLALNSRMNIDLIGRISNVVLGLHRPLVPLFEAVVNSIHSIESEGIKNGKIVIHVERDGPKASFSQIVTPNQLQDLLLKITE
jgi:hypothetical protein